MKLRKNRLIVVLFKFALIIIASFGLFGLFLKPSGEKKVDTGGKILTVYNLEHAPAVSMVTHLTSQCEITRTANWTFSKYHSVEQIDAKYNQSQIQDGGLWTCHNATGQERPPVGLLVPYRDRKENLLQFVGYMPQYFMDTGQSFQIFFINQMGTAAFNRATLLNVGYREAKKINPNITCFVYHDVDKVPLEYLNYSCSTLPKVLFKSMYRYDTTGELKLLRPAFYGSFVGGVLLMPENIILQINGCTNVMHGWGGEDDNLASRFYLAKIKIEKTQGGKYIGLKHNSDKTNKGGKRSIPLCQQLARLRDYDGVSTVKYQLQTVEKSRLFTTISVDLPGPTAADQYNEHIDRDITTIIKSLPDEQFRKEMVTLFSRFIPALNTTSVT